MTNLSKYKINNLSGKVLNTNIQLNKKELSIIDNFVFADSLVETYWDIYNYESSLPLAGEELFNITGPFIYPIVCCIAQQRLLLLSHNKKIINVFIDHIHLNNSRLKLTNCFIDVDSFVREISNNKPDYLLTSINAFYPGRSDSIKYLSFYGDNISNADIFKNHMQSMNFYKCGIRETNSIEELLKVGNDGTISFVFNDIPILRNIDAFFLYIKENNFFKL